MTLSSDMLLYIPVLLFALSVHEFAHAWTAKMGGDVTAASLGRLTINPIAHIDPIGTVLLPVISILLNGFPMIFWAKPVPVNLLKLRSSVWYVYVSMAGPLSNVILVVLTALIMKAAVLIGGREAIYMASLEGGVAGTLLELGGMMIGLNVLLAVFNMIPIPPLDGSSLVYHFFIRPRWHLHAFWASMQQAGFILLFILIQFPPVRALLGYAYHVPTRHIMSWIFS